MNAITFRPGSPERVVGLVNNAAIAGQQATDAQFTAMLLAAAPGPIRIRRFAQSAVAPYEPIDALWDAKLDGLIVTGAEPRAVAMADEPSWPLLARLVEWAAERTQAAIWSCLAAHAAVHQLDRLPRRRLPRKLSGVFACRNDDASFPVPHSRFNDIDTTLLLDAGYAIVSRLGDGPAADAFAKPVGRSAFLMLQGHPEYAADTLCREYRRDLRRWTEGADCPAPPDNYFDPDTHSALLQHDQVEPRLAALDAARLPEPAWHAAGISLFRAWLAQLDLATSDRRAAC